MTQPLKSLASAWRESPLLWFGLLVTILASLLPIWIGRYIPLLDYPGHLANLFVWRHLHDPALGFDRYYETNLQPLPYWVQYGIEYLLAIPFGEDLSQKIFLSLAIGLLPASVALYAKQLGRDPWLGVLAFPLAWNMNVSHGFLAYVGGLPLLFLALWALDRFASQPSWTRGLLTLALGVSLYFSHILIWGAFLCVGAVTAILAARPLTVRRFLCLPLPMIPVFLIGVWAQIYGNADKTNLPVSGKGLQEYEGVYNDFSANLGMISGWTMNTIPELRDEQIYSAILLLCWLILIVTGLFPQRSDPQAPKGIARFTSLFLSRSKAGLLIISILYFKLPRSLIKPFYWFAINRRLAVLVTLFALLQIRGGLARNTMRRTVLLFVMALSVVYFIDISAHFARFNRRNHGFEELLAQVPKGKQVLPLMFAPGDPDSLMNCFNQWGSYLQIRQGGYMTPFFPVEFPLKHRKVKTPHSPSWDAPQDFRFTTHAAGWDYFLLHGPSRIPEFSVPDPRVRLIDRRGEWSLFENLVPQEHSL